ncbi:MAG: creatininase family protein [Anaerolineales bacterium]|nr:MAG: creatininase family protein [Anaerolineales bacterium]
MLFDELTWPEVAALPRQLPLVLPLGDGYEWAQLEFGSSQWARLPCLHYGWPGSAIAVAPQLFDRVLRDVFRGLQQDGFSALTLLHPRGLHFDLPGVTCRAVDVMTFPGHLAGLDHEHVVLLPLGHTEQHGHHLPLSTDTLIIDAIAREVVQSSPQSATSLPVLPYGVSTHRRTFAGTFNLDGRTYEDFLLAVIGELIVRGADRFYLLNGHGGNHSFLVNVAKFAGERFPQAFTATSWLHTAGAIGSAALQRLRRSSRGGMGHAGELETALMLHLHPGLVHMERVVDETDFIASEHFYMDWIEGGELIANPPWTDDTQTGSYGAGSLATAENGAHWLEAAVKEKRMHVRAIHEQQDRRRLRRAGQR